VCFPLFYSIRHAFAEGSHIDEIPRTLAKDYLYNNSEVLVTLLGGHDDGRFMSEKGATIAGLKLANAFVLTTRGIPQLYCGDEIAMTGRYEPTTRADFPGGFPGDAVDAFSREGRKAERQEAFEFVRTLANLRQRVEPLQHGKLINLHVSEQQYVFARKSEIGCVVVAFNNDTEPSTIEFKISGTGLSDNSVMIDRLGATTSVRITKGAMSMSLPPRSVALLVKE